MDATAIQPLADDDIDYPSSDGKPMADSTLQYDWIERIKGNLEAIFRKDPNVFVAGDLLWYPVRGNKKISAAPDAMVVFGRPKGPRDSYVQHREAGIAPQVVFEIFSRTNTKREMREKLKFYDDYDVEEYYLYDPRKNTLQGWRRVDAESKLSPIDNVAQGWVSPRLKVRFDLRDELILTRPNGRRFLSYVEDDERADLAEKRAEEEARKAERERLRAEEQARIAEQEKMRAEEEARKAEEEARKAEQERLRAEEQTRIAEQENLRANQNAEQIRLLQEKLRSLGIDPQIFK